MTVVVNTIKKSNDKPKSDKKDNEKKSDKKDVK